MRLVAHIVVPGKPRPKARARKARTGYFYNPSSEEEANIRSYLQPVLRDWKATGPVEIYARFFFNSNPRTEIEIWESDFAGAIPKADADNLLKLTLDALSPWMDDRLVVRLCAEKVGKDA